MNIEQKLQRALFEEFEGIIYLIGTTTLDRPMISFPTKEEVCDFLEEYFPQPEPETEPEEIDIFPDDDKWGRNDPEGLKLDIHMAVDGERLYITIIGQNINTIQITNIEWATATRPYRHFFHRYEEKPTSPEKLLEFLTYAEKALTRGDGPRSRHDFDFTEDVDSGKFSISLMDKNGNVEWPTSYKITRQEVIELLNGKLTPSGIGVEDDVFPDTDQWGTDTGDEYPICFVINHDSKASYIKGAAADINDLYIGYVSKSDLWPSAGDVSNLKQLDSFLAVMEAYK